MKVSVLETPDETYSKFVNTQLNTFDIPHRTLNALRRKGIRTIKDFIIYYGSIIEPDCEGDVLMSPSAFTQKEADKLSIRNFGIVGYKALYIKCNFPDINKYLREVKHYGKSI